MRRSIAPAVFALIGLAGCLATPDSGEDPALPPVEIVNCDALPKMPFNDGAKIVPTLTGSASHIAANVADSVEDALLSGPTVLGTSRFEWQTTRGTLTLIVTEETRDADAPITLWSANYETLGRSIDAGFAKNVADRLGIDPGSLVQTDREGGGSLRQYWDGTRLSWTVDHGAGIMWSARDGDMSISVGNLYTIDLPESGIGSLHARDLAASDISCLLEDKYNGDSAAHIMSVSDATLRVINSTLTYSVWIDYIAPGEEGCPMDADPIPSYQVAIDVVSGTVVERAPPKYCF